MRARPLTTLLPIVLTVLAVLTPALRAGESDQDWKLHKAEFEKAMAGGVPAEMENAVRGLGRAERPEAVDILFNILNWTNPKISKLLADREKMNKQIDQLIEVAKRQNNTLSQGDHDRLMQLIEVDLKKVNEEIIAENFLRNAAIEALSSMRHESAVARMVDKGLEHSSWRVRSGVVQALAEIKPESATPQLVELVGDKDPKVQMVAMDTLAAMGKKEAVHAILKELESKNWQVRVTAARALGRLGDTSAIKPLIDRMQEEEGRMLEDFDAALADLTGHTTHGNSQAWIAWWNANKDKIEEVVSKKEETSEGDENVGKTVTFYGITTRSKRIMFIIDISGSMDAPASGVPTGASTGSNGGAPFAKLPAQPKRIDVAKYELKNAIFGLPEDAKFNVIFFNHHVEMVSANSMLDAKKPVKEKVYKWIDDLKHDGATNIYDSLVKGFELAGQGNADANFKVGVDTIFFLTDGEPSHGAVQDPNKIIEDIMGRNALRKIKIHCIGIGEAGMEFLKKLAADNDGQFVQR